MEEKIQFFFSFLLNIQKASVRYNLFRCYDISTIHKCSISKLFSYIIDMNDNTNSKQKISLKLFFDTKHEGSRDYRHKLKYSNNKEYFAGTRCLYNNISKKSQRYNMVSFMHKCSYYKV